MSTYTRIPRLPPSLRVFSLTLLYTITPALYLTRNHFSLYTIDGSSMSPLLSPSYAFTGQTDIVLFRKDIPISDDLTVAEGGTGRRGKLERGMVVLFPRPDSENVRWVVKRVVAVEGDVVTPVVRRRRYDAGGRSIAEEDGPLRNQAEQNRSRSFKIGKGQEKGPRAPPVAEPPPQPVKVPYGHIYVEGVNIDDTIDSTEYGPLSKSLVAGVATRIVWPPSRFGEIDWKKDWMNSCSKRVKLAREEERNLVPAEWAM